MRFNDWTQVALSSAFAICAVVMVECQQAYLRVIALEILSAIQRRPACLPVRLDRQAS